MSFDKKEQECHTLFLYLMSLPVGHGLVGIAIAKKTRISLPLAFILANLPDIDYFFGLFFAGGNMLALHRSILTHSVFFVIFVAFIFWLWGKIRGKEYKRRQIIGIGLIVASHLVLDSIILPYAFDITIGTKGFFDFLFAHVLSFEFFYNILIDIIFYGTVYIIIMKFVFKAKLLS